MAKSDFPTLKHVLFSEVATRISGRAVATAAAWVLNQIVDPD